MNEEQNFTIKPCKTCNNYVPIDMSRILRKLDSLFGKSDFDEADRLFKYWLNEAENSGNDRAKLELHNEYMGFCRKLGRGEDAIMNADKAYQLVSDLDLKNTISGATVCVNVGTVYKAFNRTEESIKYFDEAKKLYETYLNPNDKMLAGLYNNMALAYVDLKKFDEAEELYNKAIDIMMNNPGGELDAAISHLNRADLIYAKYKNDKNDDYTKYEPLIQKDVETAWGLFNLDTTVHDDYYRFVCEKSAPSFAFYGYFVYSNELKSRSVYNP